MRIQSISLPEKKEGGDNLRRRKSVPERAPRPVGRKPGRWPVAGGNRMSWAEKGWGCEAFILG